MPGEFVIPTWVFEQVDPGNSGSSGKIIDLFRNEADEIRGLFAEDAPPYAATLMAREVVQNSWDAATELQRDVPEVHSFAIDFDFVELVGESQDAFASVADLEGLQVRVGQLAGDVDPHERLGLGQDDYLTETDPIGSLRVCRIIERGAVGMYGPWRGAESRMYLAMLSIGYNEKADGSGGTFGYGKAGLIRASRSRIVIAYSCFRERADDPGVTRRLLGVTYWGQYTLNGDSFNGFARYGNVAEDGKVMPLENEAADAVAQALGIEARDSTDVEQLGTTFIVIDPGVEPGDLREAIERNWWPALIDQRFSVEVNGYDNNTIHCRPRVNPRLSSFVHAYEYVIASTDPESGQRIQLGRYGPQGSEKLDLGTLVLVADPGGWSFPSDAADPATSDLSLVALMRDTRMVVEYHLPGDLIAKRSPFVRGVYVASPELNVHLAKTEPKGHERWETRPSDEVPADSVRYASEVLRRIKNSVKDFQDELRPEVDASKAVRLPRFDERLKKLQQRSGQTPKPVPQGDRLLELNFDTRRVLEHDAVRIVGTVDVRLQPHRGITATEIALRFALALDEDGRRGELIPISVKLKNQPLESSKAGEIFKGRVSTDWLQFTLESETYRADWTSRLLVKQIESESAGESD